MLHAKLFCPCLPFLVPCYPDTTNYLQLLFLQVSTCTLRHLHSPSIARPLSSPHCKMEHPQICALHSGITCLEQQWERSTYTKGRLLKWRNMCALCKFQSKPSLESYTLTSVQENYILILLHLKYKSVHVKAEYLCMISLLVYNYFGDHYHSINSIY